jgi:hypothetical protein
MPRPAFVPLAIALAILFCLSTQPIHAWYPLNDTGIQFCGEAEDGNNAPCTSDEPQGQDAHYGRDAAARAGTLTKVGAGEAGFDFTKISNAGNELPASAQLGNGPNDWACTRDNVTGIIWEVKVNDSNHLRHKDHGYTWYFTNSPDGIPGYEGSTSSCNNTLDGRACNTENYMEQVNSVGLCGYTDWRAPSIKELESIVNHDRDLLAIDRGYFPSVPISYSMFSWWSSSAVASHSLGAWGVNFLIGATSTGHRSFDFFLSTRQKPHNLFKFFCFLA